jgi:hypothetical protein
VEGVSVRRGGLERLLLLTALVAPLLGCRQTVVFEIPRDGGGGGEVSSIGNGGAGGGTSTDAGGDQVAPNCQSLNLNLTQHLPEVILSVDRSFAMAQVPFGNNSATRLTAVQMAISKIVHSSFHNVVRFGYQEFPSPDSCPGMGDVCCAGPVTKPSMNSWMTFPSIMSSCDTATDNCSSQRRPIADALAQCQSGFSAGAGARVRSILVVTTGDPTCSSNGPVQMCPGPFDLVGTLADMFVKTYFLKVGEDVVGNCLMSLAQNGGGAPSSSPGYYLARGPSELESALLTIVQIIAQDGCEFELPNNVDPSRLQVSIDNGPPFPPSDMTSGWTVDSSSNRLVLHGSACDQLINAQDLSDLHVMTCAPRH